MLAECEGWGLERGSVQGPETGDHMSFPAARRVHWQGLVVAKFPHTLALYCGFPHHRMNMPDSVVVTHKEDLLGLVWQVPKSWDAE